MITYTMHLICDREQHSVWLKVLVPTPPSNHHLTLVGELHFPHVNISNKTLQVLQPTS